MRVHCNLPNMSREVSGVRFVPDGAGGWLSDDLTPALAEAFATVPGYRLVPDADSAAEPSKRNRNAKEPTPPTKEEAL